MSQLQTSSSTKAKDASEKDASEKDASEKDAKALERLKIRQESSARYRQSIEDINRSRDSDIEKSLRR